MKENNLQTTPPVARLTPTKQQTQFPKLLSERAGSFYTLTTISTQLIALAVVYLVSAICLLLSDETAGIVSTYANFSTQIILLGCVFIFCKKYRVTLKEAGFRKTQLLPCIIGVLFGAGVIFTVAPFENMFDYFLSFFGYEPINIVADIPMDGGLVFLALFTVAVLPAFGEELIFRGIILESTKKFGSLQACFLNGLLFSLFHCNPSQTCYTFLMGAAFALIAIRCNSVIPTITVHFLNNAYSVLMLYFNITEFSEIAVTVIIIFSLIFTVGGLIYFLDKNKSGNEPKSQSAVPFLKRAAGGLVFNIFFWLMSFVYNIM